MAPVACLLAAVLQAQDAPLAVPFLKQQKNGCGAASVAMVMAYWQRSQPGRSFPAAAEVYTSLYDVDLKGIPLAEMKRYLESQGFDAFTLRGTWEDLENHLSKGRPVIAAVRKKPRAPVHFVVVTGIQADGVWVNDPTARKPRRVKRAGFEKQWELSERWILLAGVR